MDHHIKKTASTGSSSDDDDDDEDDELATFTGLGITGTCLSWTAIIYHRAGKLSCNHVYICISKYVIGNKKKLNKYMKKYNIHLKFRKQIDFEISKKDCFYLPKMIDCEKQKITDTGFLEGFKVLYKI